MKELRSSELARRSILASACSRMVLILIAFGSGQKENVDRVLLEARAVAATRQVSSSGN